MPSEAGTSEPKATEKELSPQEKAARRKIPGNLPYTTSSGVLRSVLQKIPASERPTIFSTDFLATVLGASGGAARPVIPILKTTGLLSQTGVPTDLYAQFQTEGGRASAALQALKNGFGEVFRRNQYAHRVDEAGLVDLIVQVTGLSKTDKIIGAIRNTFQVFQEFARSARDDGPSASFEEPTSRQPASVVDEIVQPRPPANLGLVYNINIVLPETTNVDVYNAIFRSIKVNLL